MNHALLRDLAAVFATDARHVHDAHESPLVGGLHNERTGTPRLALVAENLRLRAAACVRPVAKRIVSR